MKILILPIILLTISFNGIGQFNDTIFYKSGMEKVVEITDFNDNQVFFKSVNSKGDTLPSQIKYHVILQFVMYDNDGILQYNSHAASADYVHKKTLNKYPDSVSVSKHQFSINPFLIPFLSLQGKYNYRFGNKMQYSICSRALYLGPPIEDDEIIGNILIGVGFQFAPYYNDRFAFGVDFVPMIGIEDYSLNNVNLFFPVSFDFDFYFTRSFGLSADFGFGNIYENLGNQGGESWDSFFMPRFHIGLLFQLKGKKTFDTNYR